MKKIASISTILLLALSTLLVQCKKNDLLGLNGTASIADFSAQITALKDTLPYAYIVTFTNASDEAVQFQWDFGDNTGLSSEKNPKHQYATGGIYNVRLTSVGTNGNNTITKSITVTDACQDDFFTKLTGCTSKEWTWSTDNDAIKVLAANGTTVDFSGPAANCQVDDVYKFYGDGRFEYKANGQTFDAQSGFSCIAPKTNATKYSVVSKTGLPSEIILGLVAGGILKPFIGTTDLVDNNKYTVISYTEDNMVIRGVLNGTGGKYIQIKLKKVSTLTLANLKNILTGGSSKSWRLDPASGANSIVVGTENNVTQYFAGGPLDNNCQSDDVFTFTSADKINYNANGSTFNGGNVAPNYNCGADRSYTNITYTFTATTGGVAGLAAIQLPQIPPTIFIGTTDVPSENVYRVIEISATKMVLRAGNGAGTVFQFKFVSL
ncbi:MAG: PKD domain-containing protein [Bacteroidota bacterium]|nr:PKD domain-containing protein [Bacteroidota bacterium]